MGDDRTTHTPTKTEDAPTSVKQELAEWLRALRLGWTQSLEEPLEQWVRLFIAGAGTFTWLVGVVLFAAVGDPRFANFVVGGVTSGAVFTVLSIFVPLVSLWFGWLIAFVPRRSGPIRLFLDGLLLPTATLAVIAVSMGRMPSTPMESTAAVVERANRADTIAGFGPEDSPDRR